MNVTFKKCTEENIPLLYKMTGELIEMHSSFGDYTMTEERLAELEKSGAVISYTAYADDKPAGIINFFYKYTTFSGRKVLYLEDLYVRQEFRCDGIGAKFIELLKKIAAENDCEEIEWKCASFNEKGKRFYDRMGAKHITEWDTYTISREQF